LKAFKVRGKTWGRARLALTYTDGSTQSISYYVTKPASQAVADLGNFLFTRQWFDDPNDPFHRSPSVMSYDRETNKIVTQDSRVWIAGLGDEGGSGSWLAAAMKEFGQPRKEEVAKYEQFVDRVLWGGLQYTDGPNRYGARKSLFYSHIVRITLARADRFTPNARLRVQQPARIAGIGTYTPSQRFINERDAFTIPLGRSTTVVDLEISRR
jgi:hypothetical protein